MQGLLRRMPVWNVERPYLTGQALIKVRIGIAVGGLNLLVCI